MDSGCPLCCLQVFPRFDAAEHNVEKHERHSPTVSAEELRLPAASPQPSGGSDRPPPPGLLGHVKHPSATHIRTILATGAGGPQRGLGQLPSVAPRQGQVGPPGRGAWAEPGAPRQSGLTQLRPGTAAERRPCPTGHSQVQSIRPSSSHPTVHPPSLSAGLSQCSTGTPSLGSTEPPRLRAVLSQAQGPPTKCRTPTKQGSPTPLSAVPPPLSSGPPD